MNVKKLLFMLVAVMLLLVGCGGKTEENSKQDESTEQELKDRNVSDDPLEVGNKKNDTNIFQNGATTETIIGWYTSDITDDDGFNTIKFKDFEIRFSVALTESENGEREISVFGETVNNMDVTLDFYETFNIITDQQEKVSPTFDFGGGAEPGEKDKFFDTFLLEYDVPESFTFIMKKPAENKEESLLWFDEKETISELEFTLD